MRKMLAPFLKINQRGEAAIKYHKPTWQALMSQAPKYPIPSGT
jgi:hypothetical protein